MHASTYASFEVAYTMLRKRSDLTEEQRRALAEETVDRVYQQGTWAQYADTTIRPACCSAWRTLASRTPRTARSARSTRFGPWAHVATWRPSCGTSRDPRTARPPRCIDSRRHALVTGFFLMIVADEPSDKWRQECCRQQNLARTDVWTTRGSAAAVQLRPRQPPTRSTDHPP
jgi:hypothetical protein